MKRVCAAMLVWMLGAGSAVAQDRYTLDAKGDWVAKAPAVSDAESAPVLEARRLLAEDKPGQAISILDDWIEAHETGDHPLLARAFLLRGDATLADGDEFIALYDYEAICRRFPASEEFATACERELEIATRYAHGLKRKWLGMRLTGAGDVAEELLIRVHERMSGSPLAEKALLELGDYYYRTRDLKSAATVYEAFLQWFPRSEHGTLARERRVFCTIGQFRGPDYESATLTDGRILVAEFIRDDPQGAARVGVGTDLADRLEESSARQVLIKAEWYLRRSDPVSARYVLRRLVKAHPRTAAAAEALRMMDERGWAPAPPAPPEAPAPAGQPPPSEPAAAPTDPKAGGPP